MGGLEEREVKKKAINRQKDVAEKWMVGRRKRKGRCDVAKNKAEKQERGQKQLLLLLPSQESWLDVEKMLRPNWTTMHPKIRRCFEILLLYSKFSTGFSPYSLFHIGWIG